MIKHNYAIVVALALLFGSMACGATTEELDLERMKKCIEPSVVYLQFWTEGGLAGSGTGFIVLDKRNQKWILTTAHGLAPTKSGKRIVCTKYRMQHQSLFAECKEAIVDEKHDIAMLRPHPEYELEADALTILKDNEPLPTTLYAFGSASGLNMALSEGKHVAEELTAREWATRLVVDLKEIAPFSPDTTFIRHGISIASGYSGCPVVTKTGAVVGVQSRILANTPFVGFAIHFKHIRDFDWTQQSAPLEKVDLRRSSIDTIFKRKNPPTADFHADVEPEILNASLRPITIPLNGVKVEAPLIHHGYAEKDAEIVIEKYLDKEWYSAGRTRARRLQQLLDRIGLVKVSCPVLGFRMLVPDETTYSIESTRKPDGILIKFVGLAGRKAAFPYDRPLSIWVTVEPESFTKVRQNVHSATNAAGKEAGLTAASSSHVPAPTPESHSLIMLIDARFVSALGISLRQQATASNWPMNLTHRDLFEHKTIRTVSYLQSDYASVKGRTTHIVRTYAREPIAVVTHLQVTKAGLKAFDDPEGIPNATLQEYLVLASSLSLDGEDGLARWTE